MRKQSLLLTLISCWFVLSACSSVNIRTDALPETRQEPDYQQRFTYWFWGLKGEHEVNVREICLERGVEQLQAVSTFSDSLLNIITIGIYAPRTARVWCSKKPEADISDAGENS